MLFSPLMLKIQKSKIFRNIPKKRNVFLLSILIPETRLNHVEVSIALIADKLKSKGQDILPSIYSGSITELL